METVNLAAVRQRLKHHHCAAQCPDHTQDDRRGHIEPEEETEGSQKGGGNGNLENTADDYDLAQAGELPERDLDSDSEHQQHHADFGQRVHGIHISNGGEVEPLVAGTAGHIRADDHAHGEVTQHGRRAQRPGRHATEEGSDDNGHQVDEQMAFEVRLAHFSQKTSQESEAQNYRDWRYYRLPSGKCANRSKLALLRGKNRPGILLGQQNPGMLHSTPVPLNRN